jgi:hypothetical protein
MDISIGIKAITFIECLWGPKKHKMNDLVVHGAKLKVRKKTISLNKVVWLD